MRKYYKPSGKYSIMSLVYFVLSSLIILPLLGLLYAYAIWYIPFFYVNFLITIGFGFAVGIVMMYFVVILGKVRNRQMATILGALGGLVAMYFHWSVWADLVINAGESYGNSRIGVTVSNANFLQVFNLAKNPGLLFELIGEINKKGTWGFKGFPVSGIFLAIIWLLEAVVVIFFGMIPPRNASQVPFCETNNAFFKDKKTSELNLIGDKQQILNSLENDDLAHLESLSKVANKEQDSHSIFTVYSSKNNEYYVSLVNQIAKGKGKFERKEIISYLSIKAPTAKVLLSK
ncbi:MAG: hypothetical protein QM710_13455 [Flavobacterium sp.]